MPPLPVVAKTVKVACVGTVGGDVDIVSRFYIAYTGTAPAPSDLNTFCTAVASSWSSHLAALHNTQFTLTKVTAEDLSSATSASGLWSGSDAGTRSGSVLPTGVAMVISYEIARRYRGGHPRGYWPMGNQADVGGAQNWSSSFITAVTSGWAAFVSAVLGDGWTGAGTLSHVNVSYYEGFTVVTNPITGRARNVPTPRSSSVIDAVAAYRYNTRFGSQRRRNLYG